MPLACLVMRLSNEHKRNIQPFTCWAGLRNNKGGPEKLIAELFTSVRTLTPLCAVLNHLVTSDALQLHGLQPTRLLRPWTSPSKNTGVGSHSFLQPRNQTRVSCIAGGFFTSRATKEAPDSPWLTLTHILTLKPVPPHLVNDLPPIQLPSTDPQPICDSCLALQFSQLLNPFGSALQISRVFSTSLYPPHNHCINSGSHFLSPG